MMTNSCIRKIKRVAVLGLALCLFSCSSRGGSDTKNLIALIRMGFGRTDVTMAQAAAIPYATLGLRMSGGGQAMATLATDNGRERLWLLGEKIGITTNYSGRILRTSGLPYNLGWSLAGPPVRDGTAQSWRMDYPDLQVYGALVTCQQTVSGYQGIKVLGQTMRTLRKSEVCRSADLGWNFTNQYWVDVETGAPWKSLQHIHPKQPPLELVTLRPPE